MGHADSRMVERVYGRLEPAALAKLIAKATGSTSAMLSRQSEIRWIWWTDWTLAASRLRVKWLPELGSNQRPTD